MSWYDKISSIFYFACQGIEPGRARGLSPMPLGLLAKKIRNKCYSMKEI